MAEAAGLYYETHGDPAAPPLILSSGLGGSASYWAPNIPALAEHFHVIAYDHRGTGRSDRASDPNTCVEAMAADLAKLIDTLGFERAHFIGHALGAMIGLELARTRIDKLIAVNAWAELDPHTRRCFATRLDLLHYAGPAAFVSAQPLFLYPPDWISKHDAELDAEARQHLSAFAGAEVVAARIGAVQSWRPELDDISSVPCLVIGTRDDFLVPVARSRQLAEMLPDAQYHQFDWGGHAVNVTDPATFNRIVLEFLRS